jgi:MinD superfamily P-loop ATPase
MGDNKVMDYIKSENIPLLMEIPFKQEIAEIYAGGKLVTDNDELLEKQLLAMINKINENYGDSNN